MGVGIVMADEARSQIAKRLTALITASNGRELDRAGSFYTENATVLMNEGNPVVGRENIVAFMKDYFKDPDRKIEHLGNEYFELTSDLSAITNDIYVIHQPSGNPPLFEHAFILWKKVNGEWCYDREVSNHPLDERATVKQHIEGRINKLFDALNKGDVELAGSFYTEDATEVPQEGTVSSGKQAIKDSLRQAIPFLKTMVFEGLYHFEQLNENTVYTNSHAKTVDDNGKLKAVYRDCQIWKKVDGEWYIRRDLFHKRPRPTSE